MDTTAATIESRLETWGRGRVFFLSDFADLEEDAAVRKHITRLCDKGTVTRYGRGIFHYPVIETTYGLGAIPATNEAIARAYAKNRGIALYLTQDAARNILGLSTQNQVNAVYQTDGKSRHIDTGLGRGITLVHTSDNRLRLFASNTMRTLAIALRGTGTADYGDEQSRTIAARLDTVPDEDYIHDIRLMTKKTRQILASCRRPNS